MKKRSIAAAAILIATIIGGCGQVGSTGGWSGDVNGIYVNRGMEIEEALVYTSEKDTDTYNQEEMKTFLEESVVEYNTAKGGPAQASNTEGQTKLPVALKSCKLDGKTGSAVFTYATGDDLVAFAQEAGGSSHTLGGFSVQKVSEAGDALSLGTFVKPDGTAATIDEVKKEAEAIVITAEGAATVYTEGTIAYVSNGVTIQDKSAVTPQDGTSFIIFK